MKRPTALTVGLSDLEASAQLICGLCLHAADVRRLRRHAPEEPVCLRSAAERYRVAADSCHAIAAQTRAVAAEQDALQNHAAVATESDGPVPAEAAPAAGPGC